jgi:hypothetical protein
LPTHSLAGNSATLKKLVLVSRWIRGRVFSAREAKKRIHGPPPQPTLPAVRRAVAIFGSAENFFCFDEVLDGILYINISSRYLYPKK